MALFGTARRVASPALWRGLCGDSAVQRGPWGGGASAGEVLGAGKAQNGDDHKGAAPPCAVCRRWTRPGHAKTGMGRFLPAPGSKMDGVFTTACQIANPTSLVNKLSPNSQLGLCRFFEKPSRTKRKQWFLGNKRDAAGPNFCPEVEAFKVSLSRALSFFGKIISMGLEFFQVKGRIWIELLGGKSSSGDQIFLHN